MGGGKSRPQKPSDRQSFFVYDPPSGRRLQPLVLAGIWL
jgi:hypothetical protein